jgi:hypothetical protein
MVPWSFIHSQAIMMLKITCMPAAILFQGEHALAEDGHPGMIELMQSN